MQLDLNLLTALDALLDEGSVSGAAQRLHLSQPAVSRALGRLRRITGDQILVRAGQRMLPTPYAEEIRGEVHTLLDRSRALLSPVREFEPGTLERTFTLRASDALTLAVLPVLAPGVAAAAPGVTLRFLAETETSSTSLRADGEVDAQINGERPTEPDMRSRILGSDSLVLLAAGPDAFGGAEPCLENLAERRFVIISRRGRTRDFVDDALAAAGLTRRVALTVPTLEAAAAVMRGGGLLTVVPRTSARALTETHGLHAWTPPFATEPLQAVLSWHARFDSDPAHAWLRQQVADAAGQFLRAR